MVHHLLNILRCLAPEFWAAIVGALVGGLFVIVAQLVSNSAQRKRDREAEREAVKAILRAIKAELKTFNEKALVRLEEIFTAREGSREALLPLAIAPLKQNYFIVFDSNAAALGKINDLEKPGLLGKIVTLYSAARSLLDSINYNNQRYQTWERLTRVPLPTPETTEMGQKLKEFADEIRAQGHKLRAALKELLADIEKYLNL